LYESDYKFREIYLITTSADNEEGVVQTVINGLNGWIACLDKAQLCGYVDGGGVNNQNDVIKIPELFDKAYNMGKNI
jgi:hypothetical protein